MTELEKRKHPDWCKYPVTGEWHPQIDMCWSFLDDKNIKKEKCKGCEFFTIKGLEA